MSIAQYCVDTGPYIAPGTTYPVGTNLPGGAECAIGPLRYLDVANNTLQIQLFNSWWQEQISQFGMQVNYYINLYSLSGHDFFYGEQPLAGYYTPVPIVMCLTLNNDSIILSKFGIQGNADITALVAIKTFTDTLTASSLSGIGKLYTYEPKAGDLIELSEFGTTRPNGRSGQIYEITERVDQQGSTNTPLMGHYVWMIKGKRYAYTYEPNAPRENLSDQVYDNKYEGEVPLETGDDNTSTRIIEDKLYTQNVDNYTRNNVYSYGDNKNVTLSGGYLSYSGYSGRAGAPNTNVYGAYEDPNILVNLFAAGGTTRTPSASALGVDGEPNTYLALRSPNN
jgi:hypothetical protein